MQRFNFYTWRLIGLLSLALGTAGCRGETSDFSEGPKRGRDTEAHRSAPVPVQTPPSSPASEPVQTFDPIETSDGDTVTDTTAVAEESLNTGAGSGSGASPKPFNLNVKLGTAALKVLISADKQAPVECTSSCLKAFPTGTVLKVTVLPVAIAAPGKRVFSKWVGDCKVSGAANGECSITLSEDKTIEPVFKDQWSYQSGFDLIISNAVRNNVALQVKGILKAPGLPPGTCASTACDVVYIYNDAVSKNQFCKALNPGSTPGTFTATTPSAAGWNNYYNLFIAKYSGSSWQRLCNGGTDCYKKALSHVIAMNCEKESR